MVDKPSQIASMAAGQIAVQTLLSLPINLYVGESDNHDQVRDEITKPAKKWSTGH
jgi:hypothetical protein